MPYRLDSPDDLQVLVGLRSRFSAMAPRMATTGVSRAPKQYASMDYLSIRSLSGSKEKTNKFDLVGQQLGIATEMPVVQVAFSDIALTDGDNDTITTIPPIVATRIDTFCSKAVDGIAKHHRSSRAFNMAIMALTSEESILPEAVRRDTTSRNSSSCFRCDSVEALVPSRSMTG